MAKLIAKQLTYHYDDKRTIVNQVSLTIKTGEILGILGPNGAGKTTLFSILSGLNQPKTGEIYLDQLCITTDDIASRAHKGMIYLPQKPSIFHRLSVIDNLRATSQHTAQQINTLLDRFGLSKHRDQPASVLSGGQRRRLEIARCLLLKPQFILLDEPSAGVDPITIADLKEQFRQLADDGIGLVVTDHNIDETLTLCNQAILLYQGKILCQGTPQIVRNNPQAKALYFGETSPNPDSTN